MNSQLSSHIQTQTQPKQTPFNKAYFAPKSELLSWASKLLDLELTSFEQMGTGAIFCQLLDACHPGTVRLNKVNWKANCETDYISNFKIFQQGLVTNDIYKPIDINRLTKGKQYDLNELLQWIYGYYLSIKDNIKEVYNAKKKRGGQNFVFNDKKNEIRNKYRKKINRDNSKDRDNLTQISTTSNNQSSNNSIISETNNRKYFFNVSNLRQNLRNNNYRNINTNTNYQPYEDKRYRNKSKQESKNPKYYDFEERVLNNNNNINNNIYTQNKNVNNINPINNNYNTINRRYPSNPIMTIDSNNNNNFTSQSRRNFKNIFEKTPSEYQLAYDPENIKLNYEEDDLNNELENGNDLDMTVFYGLNEEEVKDLIKKEKKDGNQIKDLKNIIRKLRINILSMEKELTNIKKTISEEYKLKNFYLNKLKDIEYLYFNPVIKNSNENKNTILRQLLCSNQDSTIYLDESNYAFLRNIDHQENVINNKSTLLSKKKSNQIIENIHNMNNDDIIMKDRTNNKMSNIRLEINIDNSINQNNNMNNHEKSNKLNYSSKKNYNANYIDNLFDSFNDNSKLENTSNNNYNYNENRNPNLFDNNRSNTFYTNNNTKITNENSNLNYQGDNGKIEEVLNGKKYFAYSEKKKENLNNEDKNRMTHKTEFKGKGNNLYSEISSLLLNDSLHIPNI